MIRGFEEQTEALSEYELDTLLPVIVNGLKVKIGAENAVINKSIVSGMRAKKFIISEARVRKIINYIRTHNLIPCLIATSKGYYVTNDKDELSCYIQTLKSREDAIRQVRNCMEGWLKEQMQII